MAIRPVFLPNPDPKHNVLEQAVEFDFIKHNNGIDKKLSSERLHEAFLHKNSQQRVLEVSTKSNQKLGRQLSAFNLKVELKNGYKTSVENIYQAAKTFAHGGPYRDLLYVSALDAKKDQRLRCSGMLVGFSTGNESNKKWGLEPKSAFYDWVYLNALIQNPKLIKQLQNYTAFTDIEFNPKNSISCQARSICLYKQLKNTNRINGIMSSQTNFLKYYPLC